MDTYSWLRELADSWVLLAMCIFYVGAIFFVFRPGSGKAHKESAGIPFRYETLNDNGCSNDCEDCTCANIDLPLAREDA